MIRRLMLAAAMIFAMPASANAAAPLEGIWRGKVGDREVMLCLTPEGGSYYSLTEFTYRYFESTPLSLSKDSAGFHEGYDAVWNFGLAKGRNLTGVRVIPGASELGSTSPKREEPFTLKRVAFQAIEGLNACEHRAFLAPRIGRAKVVERPMEREVFFGVPTIEYQELGFKWLELDAGSGFSDIGIISFAMPLKRPGDKAINAELREFVEPQSNDNDFVRCASGAAGWTGGDGVFSRRASPAFVTDDFLSVVVDNRLYCGGKAFTEEYGFRNFDRRSGQSISLSQFLLPSAINSVTARPEYGWFEVVLSQEFKQLLMSRLDPFQATDGCRERFDESPYWQIGLAKGGLRFIPKKPDLMSVCVNLGVVLPWSDLAPYLSDEGKAAAERLSK